MCGPINTRHRRAEGKYLKRWRVANGWGAVEPHGSDAGAITTRAERQGDRYVLNGVKRFITTGKHADVAVVFAVTNKAAGKKGISAFIVDTRTPGYIVARIEEKLGQHASDTAQIVFEDCIVPAENLLGTEGNGYRIALANLETGRIGIAAQAVGMARAAFDAALAYARERQSFGKPIVEHQAVNFRLADMAVQIEAARQLVWRGRAARRSRASRKRRWPSSSRRRWPDACARTRSRCTAAPGMSAISRWNASIATSASARSTRVRATFNGS